MTIGPSADNEKKKIKYLFPAKPLKRQMKEENKKRKQKGRIRKLAEEKVPNQLDTMTGRKMELSAIFNSIFIILNV